MRSWHIILLRGRVKDFRGLHPHNLPAYIQLDLMYHRVKFINIPDGVQVPVSQPPKPVWSTPVGLNCMFVDPSIVPEAPFSQSSLSLHH